MTTFTTAQQTKHRKAFIEECRQKAWGSRCQADQVAGEIDKLMAHYQTLEQEDATLVSEIEALDNAIDFHTVENRQKKKGLQSRRDTLAEQRRAIAANAQHGHQLMQNLLQNAESNLELAKFAEEWEWKEVDKAATE